MRLSILAMTIACVTAIPFNTPLSAADKSSDRDKDARNKKDPDQKEADKGDKEKEKKPAASWQKIKSSSGVVKTKPKTFKFLVTTPQWRLTLTTEPDGDAKENTIRAGLLVETARDSDGEPRNWKQLEVLYNGNAGVGGAKVFQDGTGDNGEPKWFMVTLTGRLTKYKILAEDHGEKSSDR